MRLRPRPWRVPIALLVVVAAAATARPTVTAQSAPTPPAVYRPALKPPEFLEPYAGKLEPGQDAFTAEPIAAAIEAQLRGFGAACRKGPCGSAVGGLLAADARGGPLFHPIGDDGALAVQRVRIEDRPVQRAGLVADLSRLLLQLGTVLVTDFDVTAIEGPDAAGLVTADDRFDLVGRQASDGRVQANGVWRQRWRKAPGGWQIVEWTTAEMTLSRAPRPVFTELTAAAIGGTESFRRQLSTPLDACSTTNPWFAGEVTYGDRAEHCWNGDPVRPNYASRLRYHQMFIPKAVARIEKTAPQGADVKSWRY